MGNADKNNSRLIDDLVELVNSDVDKNTQPYNLFTMWDMSENEHTKLLLSLLRFKQGNKYVLINSFMQRFANEKGKRFANEVEISDNQRVEIYYNRKYVYYTENNANERPQKKTATKNSFIDGLILIKDTNTNEQNNNRAIIIENKIKDAPDQPDQVRRYIYHMHKQEHIELDNIWCFYIASDGSKSISEDSYTPSYEEENNTSNMLSLKIKKEPTTPEEVNCHIGDRFIELNYKYDITSWLREDILYKRIYPESLTAVVRAYLESLEKDLFNDRANEDLYKKILQKVQGSSDDNIANSVEDILKNWREDEFKKLLNLYDDVSNLKNEQDKGEGTEEMLSIDLEGLRRIIKSLISKIEQLAFDEFERCSVEILNQIHSVELCEKGLKWQAKHRGLSGENGIIQLRLNNGWTDAHLEWIRINTTKMYTAEKYTLTLQLHVENNKDRRKEIFGKLQDGQIDRERNCLYSKKISTETPLAKMNTNKLYKFLSEVYNEEEIKACCEAIIDTEQAKNDTETQ